MDNQSTIPVLDALEEHIYLHADGVIKTYQLTHEERVPKGIKMCTENAQQLEVVLRKLNNASNDQEITHIRGSKIIIDDQLDLNDILAVE